MSDSTAPAAIPVICDRCRAAGSAGAGDFTHLGDLLDFAPVPRKTERADGWTAERQRAFIAALSATGSKRRAAMAIGMAPFGVDQLLKHPAADSFRAAFDRALAIASANGSMKIAAGVADVAARNAQLTPPPPSRLRGFPTAGEDEESAMSDEHKLELLERIGAKFLRKIVAERQARLHGEVAAADFYLRQITHLELTFELAAESCGVKDAWEALKQMQRGGHVLLEIADSPFTRRLDEQRRRFWAATGEPMRPPALRDEWLADHGTHRTEPGNTALGQCTDPPPGVEKEAWAAMSRAEQKRVLEEVYAAEAAEQVEWERRAQEAWEASEHGVEARRDFENRRVSDT